MLEVVRRIERGPFEAAISFAAVVTCVTFLLDPQSAGQAAIGHTAHTLLPYWTALYGLGGLVVLVGMGALSLRTEAAGLLVLSAAILIQAISVGHYYGGRGVASAATFAALWAACLLRTRFLWSAHRRTERARRDRWGSSPPPAG